MAETAKPVRKFIGGHRETLPLPPSSVFKCKNTTPWIDPNLFHCIVIVGKQPFADEMEEELDEDDEMYRELEQYSLENTKNNTFHRTTNSSTQIVEYSISSERRPSLGNNEVYADYPNELSSYRFVKMNPKNTLQSNFNGSVGTVSSNASSDITDRGLDFDDSTSIILKEDNFPSSDNSTSSGSEWRRRKWAPFRKPLPRPRRLFH